MDIQKIYSDFETNLRLVERSELTISGYKSAIIAFLNYFNTNPKDISLNEIKSYLITLKVHSRKTSIAAIKSFYRLVYNSKKIKLDYPKVPEKIQVILSVDEVSDLIKSTKNIKHKTIILLLYTTAMRIDELINLRWCDVDRKLKEIRILNGKGAKGRKVPLTDGMIKQLELYCRTYNLRCFDSKTYLFKGLNKAKYSKRSVATFLYKYAELAGIKKKLTPHILRHCAATHWREMGVDTSQIKDVLGHKHLSTTETYIKSANLKRLPDLGSLLK